MKKIRCWIGNLDGSREGLVLSTGKEKARKAADLSRSQFENYWEEQPFWQGSFKAETLYTRKYGSKDAWFEGRCRA